jgi:uncharacterized protein (DUF433 family)
VVAEDSYKDFISTNAGGDVVITGTDTTVLEVMASLICFGPKNLAILYPERSARQLFSAISYYNGRREQLREELSQFIDTFDAISLWRNNGLL